MEEIIKNLLSRLPLLRRRCWTALLPVLLLLSGQKGIAQDGGVEKSYFSRISGSLGNLAVNASAPLIYPVENVVSKQIKNIISLSVVEETPSYMPDNFTATVTVRIDYGASSTSLVSPSLQQVLTVNYDKQAGTKYNAKNYLSFDGAQYVNVTVVAINAPVLSNGLDTKNVLLLQNEMRVTSYYELANNVQPSSFSALPPAADALTVSWQWPSGSGNNQTQLEWTWLEDELAGNYLNSSNVLDYNLLFNHNATRVDLPLDKTSYDIPLFYDGQGKLYYRIRAVNLKSSGSRSDGPWSTVQSLAFAGHDNNLNWQVATSYAEEGKRQTVMQYFDGSLRMRQTVTKDNTTNTTITAETFYDGQGRSAIQILPAPGINSIVAYTRNLNLFNGQQANDNPSVYFDLQAVGSTGSGTPALTTASGAAQYYSTSNPEVANDNSKNIPDAEGYPYTVTRYTPDGTGRMMSQSGVGAALKMGSGHETKYYYGSASQEELDGLFGTEAGNYTHYFKNMVKDANGQMSVNYLDMHQRTIATALAGDAPTGLVPLDLNATQYPNQAGTNITRNLLDQNTNAIRGNAVESLNSLLVPATTAYQFRYALNPASLQLAQCNSTTPVCYDCMYNLEISITDESGDLPPIVRRFNNVSLSADDDCSTAAAAFSDEVYNGTISTVSANVVQFAETLLPGSYSIRKTLTISESSLQRYRDLYLQKGLCKTQQNLIDSVYGALLTTSDCNNPTTPPSLPAFHRLTAIRSLMLSDMMPYTGQYAREIPLTGTSMYDKYDIFSPANTSTQPFYKKPMNPDFSAGYYYDAAGAKDASIYPDGVNSNLGTMSKATFDSLFAASWAESLLPHHPEYAQLQYAQQNLAGAYDWIDNFNQVGSFVSAVNNSFTSSTGHSENNDPFFTTASGSKTAMSNIVSGQYYNGLSLWQIAYGGVACKTYSDDQQRDNCYSGAAKQPPYTALDTNQMNQAWHIFQGLYSGIRDSMLTAYINTQSPLSDGGTLVAQQYKLRMAPTASQLASQNGWAWYPATPGGAPNVSMTDSVTVTNNGRCSSYINQWRLALSQCSALANNANKEQILAAITNGMVAVCEKGIDAANPYGSSTVNPNTPNDGSPRSFEEVINAVFASYGISKDQYCNPFVIEAPKPYGKNQAFTRQYISTLDTCTCKQFTKLSQAATAAGYTPSVLSSLNAYLSTTYGDTLTPALFSALQQCSILGTVTCRTAYQTTTYTCGDPNPCGGAALVAASSSAAASKSAVTSSSSPGSQCTTQCPISVCETIWYLPLALPQPLPAFLTCGFNGGSRCITCDSMRSLTAQFKSYFPSPYNTAPVLSGTLDTTQLGYNALFAKFVNYRTGLQYGWLDYAKAAASAGCDLSSYTSVSGSPQSVICRDTHVLNDSTGMFVKDPPCQKVYDMAVALATNIYEARKQQLLADFESSYRAKCLAVQSIEQFSVNYTTKEYHYTLYYYDLAGNLVKTVPPKGVRPDFSSSNIYKVDTARNNGFGTVIVPPHQFATDYRYNSLNLVMAQHTPDAGISKFWYDKLGRLVTSQQAQQFVDNKYSYTVYDDLGRITEVGQKPQIANSMNQGVSQNPTALNNWLNGSSTREQVTYTLYDLPYGVSTQYPNGILYGLYLSQQNLRNRVSSTMTKNLATDADNYTATYYTYDIHGNVDTLLQDYKGVSVMDASANRFKRISYTYDLISGKVNSVDYQPGAVDAFYHRYFYDAQNRITAVQTSRDKIVWERDAAYSFYKHGPLFRTVLGQQQVQGLDYSYTLQGWMKGMKPVMFLCSSTSTIANDLTLNTLRTSISPAQYIALNSITFDVGFESISNDLFETVLTNSQGGCTSGIAVTGQALPVAGDAYGFGLYYYPGDYKPISGATSAGVLEGLSSQAAPLYNDNIAAMSVNLPQLGSTKVYNYHYDALNRLAQTDAYNGLNMTTGAFTPVQLNDYQERFSYDPNGNILALVRHGASTGFPQVAMDSLTYNYYGGYNRLSSVSDGITAANYPADIDNQGVNNYAYDSIGNLKSDAAGDISNISWTVYGKMAAITKSSGAITYSYDASGNRISKTSGGVTNVYVRDAQGNVLSVYQSTSSTTVNQVEDHLYGSNRIGILGQQTTASQNVSLSGGYGTARLSVFTRGEKFFELTNHLGNVLTTISDKKLAHSTDNTTIDSYLADVASATDYYSFGSIQPGRQWDNGNKYRYGFNGKENDNEVKGQGNEQDYGMRIYDPRLGRFLSTDPIAKKYPELTPYQFASNRPIDGVDQDGLEFSKYWNRAQVEARAKYLMQNPIAINQRQAGTCTVAAVTYLLITREKDRFYDAVMGLYDYGQAYLYDWIKPNKTLQNTDPAKAPNLSHPNYQQEGADWIFLSSVQDSQNWFFDFNGTTKEGNAEGNSRSELKNMMHVIAMYNDIKQDFSSIDHNKPEDVLKDLQSKYDNKCGIVLEIDAKLIPSYKSTKTEWEGHNVCYLGGLQITHVTNGPTMFSFDVQTWGTKETITCDENTFKKYYKGCTYASE